MKRWQIGCVSLLASPAMGNIVANGSFESGIDGDASMSLGVTGAGDSGPVSEIQQQTSVGPSSVASPATSPSRAPASPDRARWPSTKCCGSMATAATAAAPGQRDRSPDLRPGRRLGDDWAVTSLTDLVAPEFADSVLIQIRVVTGAFDGANGYAAIDAVSFAQVPAPGALALLGLAGLANGRRRCAD